MKVSKNVSHVLFACFVGLFSILAISQPGYALQVGFLVGDVYVTRDGATRTASMGLQLQKDDIVKTAKGGMAELNFKDGSVLTVKESSKIRIVTVHGGEQDSFSVMAGIVKARFSKLKKGSHRKIYTPTTVCGIRGTEFEIAVSDSVDSKVHMKEGVVDLQNQYGKSKVKGTDQAKIPVAGKPEMIEDDSTIDKWKENKDKDFSENPSAGAERLTRHLDVMKERADNNSESISEMKNTLPGDSADEDEKDLEKISQVISTEAVVEDDMFMNQAASGAIDHILENFDREKKDIYDNFLKIKKESNKVLEQQEKNYQAIQAVKEAYKKAYGEIMDSHQEYMDSIKNNIDKDSVKPRLE
ncbi:MAG: FecR family protein [Spirochaetota bacterium]